MTGVVHVSELTKVFRVAEREAGLRASLRSLVARKWREVRAVDSISFDIEPGEVVGFLGPNGFAAKSLHIPSVYAALRPGADLKSDFDRSGRDKPKGRSPPGPPARPLNPRSRSAGLLLVGILRVLLRPMCRRAKDGISPGRIAGSCPRGRAARRPSGKKVHRGSNPLGGSLPACHPAIGSYNGATCRKVRAPLGVLSQPHGSGNRAKVCNGSLAAYGRRCCIEGRKHTFWLVTPPRLGDVSVGNSAILLARHTVVADWPERSRGRAYGHLVWP
jgi:hypothetical protein